MQRQDLNGPKRPQIFLLIVSLVSWFYYRRCPQMYDSDGLSLELIFPCFPPVWLHRVSCSELFQTTQAVMGDVLQHQLFIGILCCTFTVPTIPSIMLEEEQCMDVDTNSRRGWIWVHFSNLAIHLSSSQPKVRLLPPRSLIKQEGINNRYLRRGRLCLLKRKGSSWRKAKQ